MIPKEIKELRKKLELSQEDFARKVGVTSGTVGRWERGKGEPKTKAILEKLKEIGLTGRHLRGREINDIIIDD